MSSQISIQNLDFYYAKQHQNIFTNLNLELNSSWKLGITGPNGMGKSTLLALLSGQLKPCKGKIHHKVKMSLFPPHVKDKNLAVMDVIKNCIAPFSLWEKQMAQYLNLADQTSMKQYFQIHEVYQNNKAYELNSIIEKKWSKSGFDADVLEKQFNHLSHGQKTMALLFALFVNEHELVILDEPTTHLDAHSRTLVADFLKKQKAFILVSHDRNLLNHSIDHLLYIDGENSQLMSSNYQEFLLQKEVLKQF
ncbi:ATP-binding cassette domain-containing protein, partial [bacterium]|nr:ATP-binding cassette domain-containing protein [bacterium]